LIMVLLMLILSLLRLRLRLCLLRWLRVRLVRRAEIIRVVRAGTAVLRRLLLSRLLLGLLLLRLRW
jgi:hypothetical protein